MRVFATLCLFWLLPLPIQAQSLTLQTVVGTATVDTERLARVVLGDEVEIAVDGRRLDAVVVRLNRAPGHTSWSGTLRGGGSVAVTIVGEHAVIRIASPSGVWVVDRRRGRYETRRVTEADETGTDIIESPVQRDAGRSGAEDLVWPDAVEAIVLYTPGVAAELGDGIPVFVQAIEDAFTGSVEAAGGVPGTLRVVHHALVDYVEPEDISQMLFDVTDPFTQLGLAAQDLRDAWGADVVQLVTAGGSSCGVAFLMNPVDVSFSDSAFSVAKLSCAVDNLTSPHEIGHTLGIWHDPYVNPEVEPYAYGHGFVNTDSLNVATGRPGFRTVMAYNRECADQGGTCTRLPRFSSATVTLDGQPTGDAKLSDAVRAIGESLPTAARFRAPTVLGERAFDLTDAPLWSPPACPDTDDSETCTPGSTSARYRTLALDPGLTGRYFVRWDAPGDLFLYSGAFEPGAPTDGLIALARPDGEAPEARRTLIELSLDAEVSYTVVVSSEMAAAGEVEVLGFGGGQVFTGASEIPPVQTSLAIEIAGPNPFHGATAVSVSQPQASPTRVELVDTLGRVVRVLHDGEMPAGASRLPLDGSALAAGVYTVRVTGAETKSVRLVRTR